ncbi:glycosyltransferase family 1 protein [Bosea caraganae]|uniref:Glycosyltransferase family 1 protein n=1 Tax=Bosea caraganae TaxID=2763117 RepID=A0A370L7N2_9HYPH|nr:glycosyltransferase [Bosea caraganae]RDJ25060.1 glycosyltransferase family 1 protein [Bosea caraganae]RDJ26170.1 glycosyltransferase family 1 protein [Bosea caraganae]
MAARRFAFARISAWQAPSITPRAKAKQPIVIVGMLRQASGLGDAARKSHDALKAAGLKVYGIDITSLLLHEANYSGFDFEDGSELLGEGTVILHVSGPVVPRVIAVLGKRFVRNKRILAHWFWELPALPEDWRPALPFLHGVCASTRFVADAVRPMVGDRPVHLVSYPLEPHAVHHAKDAGGGPFTVLVAFNIASNFARKNPCASIAAFRQAFGDDPGALLIVKYLNGAAWPEGVRQMQLAAAGASNIVMNSDVLDDAGVDALYQRADVVMSLHRAEGLGLTIAEAMMREIPVIATNWSGNTDFFTSDAGIPIGFKLIPIEDPQRNYGGAGIRWKNPADAAWADPAVEEAAAALRALRADAGLRRRLGAAGIEKARNFFDPARHVERIKAILDRN